MNPAGIVIMIAGVWVISQIFAGNALQRLNIVKPEDASGGLTLPSLPNTPVTPYLPGGSKNPVLPML
jgi:hypothetical protein